MFLATAEAREDGELAARIARHVLERPAGWKTVEEPLDLGGELGRVPDRAFVIVDCLTLWAANALEAGWSDEEVERVAADVARGSRRGAPPRRSSSATRSGMGVVPATPLGRSFRDVLGRVNAVFAGHADRALPRRRRAHARARREPGGPARAHRARRRGGADGPRRQRSTRRRSRAGASASWRRSPAASPRSAARPRPGGFAAALVLAAGDHGYARRGVSAYPQEVTGQMLATFAAGGAAIDVLARETGAAARRRRRGRRRAGRRTPAIRVAAARRGHGRRDRGAGNGPGAGGRRASLAGAAHRGGARGRAASGSSPRATWASATRPRRPRSAAALLPAEPEAVCGRGTGVDDDGLARKVEVVRRALARQRPRPGRPGGRARGRRRLRARRARRRLPRRRPRGGAVVLLDGFVTGAAALVAARLAPAAAERMVASHRSPEPGHALVLDDLGLRPLLDLGLRLGEGSGAALALPLVVGGARHPRGHGDLRERGRDRCRRLRRRSVPVRAPVAFLTRVPVGRWVDLDAEDVARGAVAVPARRGRDRRARRPRRRRARRPAQRRSSPRPLAVAVEALLTGAIHLDALADSADGLGAADRERALEIMREPTIGSFGATALLLDLLAKTAALAAIVAGPAGACSPSPPRSRSVERHRSPSAGRSRTPDRRAGAGSVLTGGSGRGLARCRAWGSASGLAVAALGLRGFAVAGGAALGAAVVGLSPTAAARRGHGRRPRRVRRARDDARARRRRGDPLMLGLPDRGGATRLLLVRHAETDESCAADASAASTSASRPTGRQPPRRSARRLSPAAARCRLLEPAEPRARARRRRSPLPTASTCSPTSAPGDRLRRARRARLRRDAGRAPRALPRVDGAPGRGSDFRAARASPTSATARARGGSPRSARRHEGEAVAVVAHGGVVRVVLADALGLAGRGDLPPRAELRRRQRRRLARGSARSCALVNAVLYSRA